MSAALLDVVKPDRRRITIAILALGGQGGGVLADWILDMALANGYVAQGTSVPGVAQRTGSTVYYIEMVPRPTGDNREPPVLALNPVPGDVDIVIASELMEAGRAILRGFVSKDRTTLIGSTNRIYAISEKSALGDGTGSSERIIDAAHRRAARFIGFDMEDAAVKAGSLISSVMLGALAGSRALPFAAAAFEDAIRAGGKAVSANLKGFAAGIEGARMEAPAPVAQAMPPQPTSPAGRAFAARIAKALPVAAHGFAIEGVRRLMDYQDAAYAVHYLDRLEAIRALDDGCEDWALTRETARALALWMAYDDVVRVADLKIRATRSERVAQEVRVRPDQVLRVTEYMHPRLREVCETLPAPIGRAILGRPALGRLLAPLFAKGRHVETTGLRWFVALRLAAGLRRFRRTSLRYAEEHVRIETWLDAIRTAAASDLAFATELARNQRIIKGYGDTFDRGLANFGKVMAVAAAHGGGPDGAVLMQQLREAALADETGCALDRAIAAG
jgi:indolepyruvate ferredoxin oxidoreductase beta subunit